MKNLGNFTFSFNFITLNNTVEERNKLKSKKASQKTDIPIKIVKENVDIIPISYIPILIIRCHSLPFQLA